MKTKEEWQKQVEDYQNSGMAQSVWCSSRGIPLATFQYRLRRVRRMGSQDKFRELKFEGTGIKLKWKNLSLELDSDFDSKVLSRLLETFSRLG